MSNILRNYKNIIPNTVYVILGNNGKYLSDRKLFEIEPGKNDKFLIPKMYKSYKTAKSAADSIWHDRVGTFVNSFVALKVETSRYLEKEKDSD